MSLNNQKIYYLFLGKNVRFWVIGRLIIAWICRFVVYQKMKFLWQKQNREWLLNVYLCGKY